MKLRRVDPRSIKVPEVRVTARFDPEKEEQFKNSIRERGMEDPIICYQVGEELVLSDGLHRLVEAIDNNTPRIDVVVREGSLKDVMLSNLMAGHLRGKHPVSEMRRTIDFLFKEEGVGIDELVTKTGYTRDYVEKLLLISELTPMILKALDEERIGIGHAAALVRIPDQVRRETVFGQLMLYNWKVKDLEAYIRDVEDAVRQQQQPEAVTESRPIPLPKCFYCGEEYRPGDIANPNTCKICAGILLGSIAEARAYIPEDKNTKDEGQKDTKEKDKSTETTDQGP